jgi:eight-cysteine-cluster-containing protein
MRLLAAAALACACACVTERADPRGGAAVQRRSARVVEPCLVSGCSGQICARQALFSTCEWRPEYACFANATCGPQPGGECGWAMTDALRACLEAAGKEAR